MDPLHDNAGRGALVFAHPPRERPSLPVFMCLSMMMMMSMVGIAGHFAAPRVQKRYQAGRIAETLDGKKQRPALIQDVARLAMRTDIDVVAAH